MWSQKRVVVGTGLSLLLLAFVLGDLVVGLGRSAAREQVRCGGVVIPDEDALREVVAVCTEKAPSVEVVIPCIESQAENRWSHLQVACHVKREAGRVPVSKTRARLAQAAGYWGWKIERR